MAPATSLQIAVHDSKGLHLVEGHPNYGKERLEFSSSGRIKYFTLTKCGQKLALIANGSVQILVAPSWKVQYTLEHPTAQEVVFSHSGGYVAIWCLYIKAKDGAQPTPNLHIYDIRSGCTLLKSFFQLSQLNWQPQWSGDDSIFARNVTNEVHFYKADALDKIAHKRVQPKIRSFSLSPSKSAHLAAFFTPSVKGSPCNVNLFKYPNFKDSHQPVASKSFYKIDNIEFLWNSNCSAVLLMATGDKGDDSSYYGEKMVFLMNSKTGDSIRVTFNKSGPVSSVTWSPDGKNFFAVYGNNPANGSMYNLKAELVASFDEGARNLVMVNPVNNLVLLGGSGNISPRIEVWDLSKKSKICYQECPDLTYIEWSPCGQYVLTATCSPRLRVNNGYRIYHYSGSLLYEQICPSGTELYSAVWMPDSSAAVPFSPSTAKVQGIQSSVKTASTQRYIPPGQRAALNAGDKMVESTIKFLRQMDKYDPNSAAAVANQPPPPLSKNAARNKRRKEARKVKEEIENKEKNSIVIEEPEAFVKGGQKKEEKGVPTVQLSGDGEKKAKSIRKKLQRIEKLKKDKSKGTELDANQMVLVASETDLIAQLRTLTT